MRSLRGPSLLLSGALAAVAGLTFHRVFDWSSIAFPVVAAAALAAALAWSLGGRLGQRLLITVPASALALIVFVAATQYTLTPAGLRSVIDALVNGWADTLSSTIPSAATPARLTFVIAVTWIAAAVSAELVLRTRATVLPIVPATIAFAVAIGYGVGAAGDAIGEAIVFVALAAVLALVRATAADVEHATLVGSAGRAVRRRLALGLPALASVVVLGTLLAVVLPVTDGRAEYDPHRDAPQPPAPLTALNPLDLVTGAHAPNNAARANDVMFIAEVRGSAPGALTTPWRLAVLDHYDGTSWTDSGSYSGSGGRVPVATSSTTRIPTREITQRVTIKALGGPWLPARDRPVRVHGGAARFDASGVLVSSSGAVHPGLRYTVSSAVPSDRALAHALAHAKPASDPAYTALPSGIGGDLTKAPSGTFSTAVEELNALAAQYRDTYQLDEKSLPGHTEEHLEAFAKAHSGTAEQFVAAFAVQARALKYAARVVVGFDGNECSGTCVIRLRDLTAWPEVKFDGVGWQRISVLPAKSVDDPRQVTPPTTATPIAQAGEDQAKTPPTRTAQPKSTGSSGPSPWLIALAVIGLVLVLVTVVLALRISTRRRRRSRRRDAGDPGARVVGAWLESLDQLTRRGLRARRSKSAQQLATEGSAFLDQESASRLRRLGELTTRSRFDVHPTTEAEAAEAWDDADAIAAALDAGATRRERAAGRIDTRTVSSIKR